MGGGGGGCPSGSQKSTTSRRGSVHQRSLPSWLPRRGCARSPSGDRPGSGLGPRGLRSGRPSRARLGPPGRASSPSRRPGAPWGAVVADRPRRGRPGWRPAAGRRGGWPGRAARPAGSAQASTSWRTSRTCRRSCWSCRLMLTPHLGSGTRQTREALTRAAVEKVLAFERRPALDGA